MGRFRLVWAVALVAAAVIGTGCGAPTSSPPANTPQAHVVASGQPNCPADQAQDLTFTGSFVGHLNCQAEPSFCYWDPPKADLTNSLHGHLVATIPVLVDGKPATVTVAPGRHYGETGLGPATFEVPSGLLWGAFTQFDLQLADMSNWASLPGGQVAVTSDDGKRVKGTLNGIIAGTSRATMTGRWGCVRQGA